ncbi:MAG TPA: hypothetical protein VJP06_03570 [Thermoplasmata archaeon]|nr:hypothetical protein [Thermoplasmata archaeon]
MVRPEVRSHVLGFTVVLAVAIALLVVLFPVLGRRIATRDVPVYFVTVALVPVVLWLVPAYVRGLTHATYRAHKALIGKDGTYVRVPVPRPIRFRDTALLAIGPFAIDLLVMSELLYLLGPTEVRDLRFGLLAFPLLLFLAGLVTSLIPGAWLLDALEIRVVVPKRAEVVRAAELFERILGPLGAAALLASFVTLLHTSGYSYEAGIFLLGIWAVRLFPPVLGAVCVYRLIVEPRVLPSLAAWCAKEGIAVRAALPTSLRELAVSGDSSKR